MNQPLIKFAPESLTTGIEIGSPVLLPTLRSGGVVVAIGYHDDGVPHVFVVKLAGEALPFLLPRNEVMRAPPGALFLSPGGDDVAPSRPFFHACGGVA